MKTRINTRLRRVAITSVVAVCGALAIAAPAGATSATATLNAGTFGLLTVPAVTFSATLNGQNQTPTNAQAIDVGDATGSGAGWNLTGSSSQFTTGGATPHLLNTGATTIQAAPSVACDSTVTCSTASNAITYPYSLPAGSSPTATKFYNAAANSGMGNQTVTPTWTLAVPANSYAGSYTSTWTISLVSAP